MECKHYFQVLNIYDLTGHKILAQGEALCNKFQLSQFQTTIKLEHQTSNFTKNQKQKEIDYQLLRHTLRLSGAAR